MVVGQIQRKRAKKDFLISWNYNFSRISTLFLMTLTFFIPITNSNQDGLINDENSHNVKCSELRMGQFKCNKTSTIDLITQQPRDCTQENIATIQCKAVDGLICEETGNRTFFKSIPCKWTNGYHLSTSLLLSVFFGTLGIDRFYLGHVGMGLLKFSTVGFLFMGQLIDIILIATENLKPKDGSNFISGFYGPSVESIRANNLTYVVHRGDWFT